MNIFSASKKRRQGGHNFIMNQSEGQTSCLLALEPRIMYDAAGLATGVDGMEAAAQTSDDLAGNSSTDTFQNEVSDIQEAFKGYVPPTQNPSSEIVFISTAVPDYQHLIQGISSDAQVVLVDPEADGVSQISEALASYRDLDAIHIVSHGGKGSLLLGQSQLTAGNLTENAEHLKVWGEALSKEGDILLYGCDVAAGKEGQAFVQQLSEITGADVAASTDATGAETLGGDWDLEEKSGDIEAGLAFSEKTLETYDHVLPNTAPVLDTSGVPTFSEISKNFTDNQGNLVADIVSGIITDADTGDPQGIAVTNLTGIPSSGDWQYSTDDGASWTSFVGVSGTSATVLAADTVTRIRFVPNTIDTGTYTLDFRAWDQTDNNNNGQGNVDTTGGGGNSAFSLTVETAQITVTNNGAPILFTDTEPHLEPITRNEATNGELVKNIITGVAIDVDGDPLGIAVTFADNANGTWQYTLDGGASWDNFNAPSETSATLLAADSFTGIRYLANEDFVGKAIFKYRAWDQTDGNTNGATGINVSVNGGSTAYSGAGEIVELKITDIPYVPPSTANPLPPLPGEGPSPEPQDLVDDPSIKPDDYLPGPDDSLKLYAPPVESLPEDLTQEEGVEPEQEMMEEGEEPPPEEEQLVEEEAADEEVVEEQPSAVVAPVEDGATVEALPQAEAKIVAPENNLTDQLAREADKATAERAEIMKIFKDVYELLQCK